MDRTLQSGLEKRTRMGVWQTRVYRLERGFLSAWPDVASAAGNAEPSRVECLFEDKQVAVVADHGDKRFKLEFPWDSSKTLLLRANNAAMKKAWMDVLQTTLRDARSQIKNTGSVFALGGAAQHATDEAYEEAAYLKTNRYLAAYVVDEEQRASYLNDLLNECFDEGGECPGSAQDVSTACRGATAAVEELMGLTEDYTEEMRGVEELLQDGEGGGLDPAVAAPKIRRFCEEYLTLAGRLVASRLMLQLSPFMDSSVAGTSSAPTASTKGELIATKKKLDEVYTATQQLSVSGKRDWFMDIRGSFLDCSELARDTPRPPPPEPAEPAQAAVAVQPELPVTSIAPPEEETVAAAATRRSSKTLFASAFSAAKAASKGASMNSWTTKGNVETTVEDDPSSSTSEATPDPSGTASTQSTGSSGLSTMRGVFRRGSRSGNNGSGHDPGKIAPSPKGSGHSRNGSKNTFNLGPPATGKSSVTSPSPSGQEEEQRGSNLFGGPSRSPSTSPRPIGAPLTSASSPSLGRPVSNNERSIPSTSSATTSEQVKPASSIATGVSASSSSSSRTAGGGAKARRAFAGGAWGGGASVASPNRQAGTGEGFSAAAEARTASGPPQPTPQQESRPTEDHSPALMSHDKPRPADVVAPTTNPSGGKRRFAGGGFSAPSRPPQSSGAQTDNPFGSSEVKTRPGNEATGAGSRGTSSAVSQFRSGTEKPSAKNSASAKPSWASEGGGATSSAVPDWAVRDDSEKGTSRDSKSSRETASFSNGGKSNGFGLAPPSSVEQGQDVAAKSPFMSVEENGPAVRRPSQRRPGESSSKKAFAGGARLF